jgi:fucose permease
LQVLLVSGLLGPILLLNADALLISLKKVNGAEKESILSNMSLRVITPYWIITGFLVVALSVVIYFIKLPPVADDDDHNEEIQQQKRNQHLAVP